MNGNNGGKKYHEVSPSIAQRDLDKISVTKKKSGFVSVSPLLSL